ncbi:IclR family transcriptional regulator [Saccharopolyspora karakumensis]|uniref:IclR family transcriptional regulator n=1 Tax=Saccharopolyspora karakumensis TaxID=2530386 RepID=A0A4V2YVL8_9PSEU|nr:IclR family transcriptional regulator [Saccharopolyspora karakumensis]TDD82027.1 IclR family transcriptional regulator [Saccharopolyspora karakumensis]
MAAEMKQPPAYAIASVDHALRLATILQLEGGLSVADAAERLGVARSTAHRLLAMLVYRDFAAQDDTKVYRAGPVLELASHSRSTASRLRQAALPHLHRLVDELGESVNLTVRTGTTTRFIACAECRQALRVGSREGMVFPAHQTTAGLLLLAELTDEELDSTYAGADQAEVPDVDRLRRELAKVRRNGFALNQGRSERGVVAIGVPVRSPEGAAIAGLSVSMPSVRYDRGRLRPIITILSSAASVLEKDLHRE